MYECTLYVIKSSSTSPHLYTMWTTAQLFKKKTNITIPYALFTICCAIVNKQHVLTDEGFKIRIPVIGFLLKTFSVFNGIWTSHDKRIPLTKLQYFIYHVDDADENEISNFYCE